MSGTWDAPCPPLSCGACGDTETLLFHIPGGWGFPAEDQGRLGLCLPCGQNDERYREKFRQHFGDEVRVVRDGDMGGAAEAVA